MYPERDSLSTGFYVPGFIANLPARNRRTRYRHAGHTRDEIRANHPWFVEMVGPDGRSGFDFEVSEPEHHKDFRVCERKRMVSRDDHS